MKFLTIACLLGIVLYFLSIEQFLTSLLPLVPLIVYWLYEQFPRSIVLRFLMSDWGGVNEYDGVASALQMPLTTTISNYNILWPRQYEIEVARLKPVFGETLIAIHHVGSTAVPALAAKPEIDILAVVVRGSNLASQLALALVPLGYRRGGDLSVGHSFFKRDVDGVRTHKLHLCTQGHAAVSGMLAFRDLLRENRRIREEYQSLKLMLEKTNRAGVREYLRLKAPFIENALNRGTIDD